MAHNMQPETNYNWLQLVGFKIGWLVQMGIYSFNNAVLILEK